MNASVFLRTRGWRECSCQSNGSVLDVVCHFLWAGLATARGFEECGKKAVWRRREEVCIYLRWWGMIFYFDLSADPILDRLASCRSHKVTMSTAKGPAWDSDSTCQDESASRGMPAGAGKISFLAVSVLVDFLLRSQWLTDQVKTKKKKYPYVMLSAVTTSLLTQRQICLFSTAIKGFTRT